MKSKKILLVEDDHSLRAAIESFLKGLKFELQSFESVDEAIKHIDDSIDVVISDVKMPGSLSGYDLLQYIRKKHPSVPLILMTGYGTIEKAVEAMKKGAYDFLVKPFSLNVLETAVHAALLDRQSTLDKERDTDLSKSALQSGRAELRKVSDRFIAKNSRIVEIIDNLKRVAPSKATILIQGESGTGKELIARMIHEFSPRSKRIFVAINCAAMPDTLLESELFGHEKGAFTGAISRQIGKFELSNNGTILLDEISEMSLTMQTKLLRVLQECEIYRVGGVKPIPLNLRVIATTNRDLYQYMKEGNFREDLYYRINVIPITVPPLRERGDDVVMMSQDFLDEFAVLHGRAPLKLTPEAKEKIIASQWRGNVRELRNTMERAVLVGNFDVLDETHSALVQAQDNAAITLEVADDGLTLDEIEKKVIITTLERFDGNRTKTAQQLGISLRTLRNKLKNYGVGNEPHK